MGIPERATLPRKLFEAFQAERSPDRSNDQNPRLLYHLTGSDALVNILSSKTIWASLATTSNDSLEVQPQRCIPRLRAGQTGHATRLGGITRRGHAAKADSGRYFVISTRTA